MSGAGYFTGNTDFPRKAAGEGWRGPPCSRGRGPDGIEGEGRGEGEQEEDEECGPGVRARGVE